MSIEIGIKGRAEDVVREENTAQAVGSGTLPVFATPAMTALMEKAAWTSLAPYLSEGESSVGTKLEITHDSASPLGIKVWAESEVTTTPPPPWGSRCGPRSRSPRWTASAAS